MALCRYQWNEPLQRDDQNQTAAHIGLLYIERKNRFTFNILICRICVVVWGLLFMGGMRGRAGGEGGGVVVRLPRKSREVSSSLLIANGSLIHTGPATVTIPVRLGVLEVFR